MKVCDPLLDTLSHTIKFRRQTHQHFQSCH